MKRLICIFAALLATSLLFAQTQQGIVKTPTRRNVDGTMTKGQYIQNATVTVLFANSKTKQSYVSGSQGKFSFPAPSPYYISSVTAKKGAYTFLDADFSKKQMRPSANAIEILVDDPNVLAKVREEAIAHERGKIRKQIRAKEDEIEALREANELTTAEYNKMLGELSDYRQSSEAIVQQIAEIYVTTDFDKLDDFNRELLEYVEEGDFFHADSLLKSQGNKDDIFKEIKDIEAANKQTEEDLAKSKEYEAKKKETFAQRLYSEHLMYLQRPLMQDSALYCLKLRAELDTTNVEHVLDYALLCDQQNKFDECKKYYLICLKASVEKEDPLYTVFLLYRVGRLFLELNDALASSIYLEEALALYEDFYQLYPDVFRPELSQTQYSLGELYYQYNDYLTSEKYFKASLENTEQMFSENPDVYRIQLVMNLISIGALYANKKDSPNCEKYYRLALEHLERTPDKSSDQYMSLSADVQNNLGALYSGIQDYEQSEKYLKAALENYETLFCRNPDAYRKDMARMQNNIGGYYYDQSDYANSEKYYKAALENNEYLFRLNPDAFRDALAMSQQCLGLLYYASKDYINSEKFLKQALDNYEILSNQILFFHLEDLARTRYYLALLYNDTQDYANAEKHFTSALHNYKQLYQDDPNKYEEVCATITWNLMAYAEDSDSTLYRHYLDEALEYYASLYKTHPETFISDWIYLHNKKIELLLADGLLDEALQMATENYALDQSNEDAKLYLGESLNYKAYKCAQDSDFDNANEFIARAMALIPDNAALYCTKGGILLMQGKHNEALEMWHKVLELEPNFLDNYPEGTELSNGLKKLGLIE